MIAQTDKEFVLSRYPLARVATVSAFIRGYFACFVPSAIGGDDMLSHGLSITEAWANAARNLDQQERGE